jgi:hypothetical protein
MTGKDPVAVAGSSAGSRNIFGCRSDRIAGPILLRFTSPSRPSNTQKALTADGASGRTSSRANRQSDKRRRAACILSRPLRFSTSRSSSLALQAIEVLSGPKRAGSTLMISGPVPLCASRSATQKRLRNSF